MKKSVSELSLVVITLLGIGLISGVVIFVVNMGTGYIVSFFDNIVSGNDTSLSSSKNINYIPINYNYSDDFNYNSDRGVAKLLSNKDIKLNNGNGFFVDDSVKSKLYKDTMKRVSIDDINKIDYYKASDDNYIVGVSNNKDNYYYNYKIKKNLLGQDKYVYSGEFTSSKSENKKVNNELVNSEEDMKFEYDDSYISMANVNGVISNNHNLINNIYNKNIDSIVLLNMYNSDVITNSATGFFISDGIIATSWTFINDSLKNGSSLVAITGSKKSYNINGIITIDKDSDIALLKTSESVGKKVKIGKINVNDEILLLGSYSGFGISGNVGYSLGNGDFQTNSLYVTYKNIGSPLFNYNGEVIGMVTGNSLDSDISNSISSNILDKYISYYSKYNFSDIKYYSISELANKYFRYNIIDNETQITLSNKEWNKYKKIGNIEKAIPLKLLKSCNELNGVSLRYLNDTNVDNNIIIKNFTSNLEKDNYVRVLDSNKKKIYSNSKFNITIFYELNYIILIIREV